MRQLLVIVAVIAAQVWCLPQSRGDEGQPPRSVDVPAQAGRGVAVADVDNDGRLDLLVLRPAPCSGRVPVFLDYDRDGRLDLFVAGPRAPMIETIKIDGGKVEISGDSIKVDGGKLEIIRRTP